MMVSSLLLAVVTAFLVGPAASFPIVSYRPSQSLHNSYNPHNTNNIIIIMSSMSSTDDTTSRTRTKTSLTATNNNDAVQSEEPHVETILFVECGFGADAHGQDPTKAAVRACRNAIEFNQIPSLAKLLPNGNREELKLDVLLAVPAKYQRALEYDNIRQTFPYGQVRIQLQDGGMIARHGLVIEEMGDTNEDMVVVCCAVTVGY